MRGNSLLSFFFPSKLNLKPEYMGSYDDTNLVKYIKTSTNGYVYDMEKILNLIHLLKMNSTNTVRAILVLKTSVQ